MRPRHRVPAYRPRAARTGAAAIEATLVALVLLVTLIAVFDMGQLFFVHQTFNERVRNAARYASVRAFNADTFKNMVLYNQPTPGGGSGVFGLEPGMVSVTRADAGTNDDRIVVSITGYPYRFFTPLIAGAFQGRAITVSIPYEVP